MERTSYRNFWIGLGILALLAFVALPAFGGMMWGGYGYGVHPFVGSPGFWGFWGLGALIRVLFWGAIIFFVVNLLRGRRRYWDHHDYDEMSPHDLPPNEILRRRYAAGEITREQYEQMRHDLEGSATA